jgi:hypothetical protein
MKSKKSLALLMIIAMLLPTFAACSESTTNAETEGTATETEATVTDDAAEEATEEETEKILPDLPDVTYDGVDFNIYCSSNAEYGTVKDDFTAEEYTGEPVNDARYSRNLAIEQKYDVKINVFPDNTTGDTQGTNVIKQSVTTADYAYDLAMLAGYSTSKLSYDNILVDLNTVEYIDLEKPWWDQRANEELEVVGKLFYTTGDISTADNEATYCIYYNKNMASDLSISQNPYDMVRDGTWTIDNYATLLYGVSSDLDGNGEYDDQDRYGALLWDDSIMGVVNGAGIKCCDIVDGKVTLSLYSEKTVSMLEKYFSFAIDKQVCFAYQRTNWDDKLLVNMFQNNQALFIQQLLQLAPKLREMDADFGVLPYYKYNEEQESYYNTVGSWHSVFLSLPKVQQDLTRTGVIVEALAAESLYTVTPAYYDVTLKDKVSRDQDSADMLDLIFETRTYDLGWYYAVGSYNESIMNLFRNYQSDFTSMYKKSEKVANKYIDKLNAAFEALDEE